ncbi:MAG: enoyl-CoA hydratase-related protein [Immundisolibacterales bacterium]|nr:enoyl-CoA hydratase-related protein [Immundisolibacterales bacterium]
MGGSGRAIDTGTELLLGQVRDGVATLTFNRPEARNALSDELTPALRRMIARLGNDPSVGALVITGAGTAFCAGGDVKGMSSDPERERTWERTAGEKVLELQQRQRPLRGVFARLPVPTIAALPGPAAGAGLAIALACDIRFAAASAFVTTGYARIGLSGDYGINWLLTRLVGTAKARELMFTADRVDAETCLRIGLVNRVFEDESLRSETAAFAARLAAGPRRALALMKRNLERALDSDFPRALDEEAERLVRAAAEEDHREAIRAFIEKRPPRFGT